ncbi:hypothetical protein MKX03_014509 [Papaver bracteatum]|nr:hypothetical protein MKX03_014509 [Papaver bracteatum]
MIESSQRNDFEERHMDCEKLHLSCQKGGADENNHNHSENGQVHPHNDTDHVNETNGNLLPEGNGATLCHDENGWEEKSPGISGTDTAEESNGVVKHYTEKRKRQRDRDMTFQDMYNLNMDFTDEDDDSDWAPFQNNVASEKWFCANCTMVNWFDVFYCEVCGEHTDSDVLSSLSSSRAQEAAHIKVKSEDCSIQKPSLEICTLVGFDERMLLHSEVELKAHPHPERPDRLRAIAATLAAAGIFPGKCFPIPAREITAEELQMVHTAEHIGAVDFTDCMVTSYFTPDTYANEHSACAARLAAGLCADLSTSIMAGHAKNGFALVRPPGHHAGVKDAMGFCLYNNAAVAALAAQRAGAKKVLILDWDVHHGNGTQEIFDGCKSVLYISLHRHEGGKFYPGTGAADEVGVNGAEGYCVNIPWKCGGVGDCDYIFAFKNIVLPIALEYSPDLTIISAGFDAARGDPLGCCDVTPAGYEQMTHMLTSLSGGKLLVILEGGYNLRSISSSAKAVIKVLLGESPVYDVDVEPSKAGVQTVLEVLEIQKKFWSTLGSTLTRIQSQCQPYPLQNGKREAKKKRRLLVPLWWKWGRKKFFYNLLRQPRFKVKRRTKQSPRSFSL